MEKRINDFFDGYMCSKTVSLKEYAYKKNVRIGLTEMLIKLEQINNELYERVIKKKNYRQTKKNSIANYHLNLTDLIGKTILRTDFIDWIILNYTGTKIIQFTCGDLIEYAELNGVTIINSFKKDLKDQVI